MVGESFGSLFLVLLSLFVVFILIFLAYIYASRGKRVFWRKSKLKEVTRYYFTNKNFISIIELEGIIYILGIGENGVTRLDKIEDEVLVDKIINCNEKDNIDFKEILRKNILISRNSEKKKTKRFEENKNEKSE